MNPYNAKHGVFTAEFYNLGTTNQSQLVFMPHSWEPPPLSPSFFAADANHRILQVTGVRDLGFPLKRRSPR